MIKLIKKHSKKILLGASFGLICLLQRFFLSSYAIESQVTSDLITFFSIAFGFYMASLAIFASSKYVSDLYQITDEEQPTKTLLNILMDKYKVGLKGVLVTTIYLVVIQFVIQDNEKGLSLSKWILFPFVAVLIFNFIYSYRMLGIIIKIVLQEAKKREGK